jgi:hypothetical protein
MSVMIRTLAVVSTVGGVDCLSANYWNPATVGGSTADANDVLGRVRAGWLAMASILGLGTVVNFDPTVLAIEATTGDLVGAFTATPVAVVNGSAAGDAQPLQTQGLITWNTSTFVNSRRVRGRTFVPGSTESFNSAGDPSPSYVTGLGSGVTAFLGTGATASVMCVWHRPNNAPTFNNGSIAPVTGGFGVPRWSVLRSRRS